MPQLFRCPGNRQRLAPKDSHQGGQHGMPPIVHGGEVATNAAKGRQSPFTPKRARDLLLHFDHPQITLGLIIREGDGQAVQKREDLLGSSHEVIEQILGRTLFTTPPPPGRIGGWRLGGKLDLPAHRNTAQPTHSAPAELAASRPAPATREPPHTRPPARL